MPFYEYRCSQCQHEDSFLEGINAPQQKTCPKCGKRRAFKRLVSAAGFQLKGSGWYVTDFRDKGKKPEKKDGDKAEKPADKKTEAGGDKEGGKDKTSEGKGKGDGKQKPAAGGGKAPAKGDGGKRPARR